MTPSLSLFKSFERVHSQGHSHRTHVHHNTCVQFDRPTHMSTTPSRHHNLIPTRTSRLITTLCSHDRHTITAKRYSARMHADTIAHARTIRWCVRSCASNDLGHTTQDSLGYNSWKENTKWMSDKTVCDWHGITCDASGRVTQISLEHVSLVDVHNSGSIT